MWLTSSGMSQGLSSITLHIRKWVLTVTVGQIIHWLIVKESLATVFSCLCHGMARYSPNYTNFAVSFRFRKPLPPHNIPNFIAFPVISQLACLFSFYFGLSVFSCAFRSVFCEKIWAKHTMRRARVPIWLLSHIAVYQ